MLLIQLPVAVLICKDFLISDVDKELFTFLLLLNAEWIYRNLVYLADTKPGFNKTLFQNNTGKIFFFFPHILHLQSDHRAINPLPTSLSNTSRKLFREGLSCYRLCRWHPSVYLIFHRCNQSHHKDVALPRGKWLLEKSIWLRLNLGEIQTILVERQKWSRQAVEQDS